MFRRVQLLMTDQVPARPEADSRLNWNVPSLSGLAPLAQPTVLVIVSVAILFARRPDQFLHPYIWVEEGLYTLRFYAESGWSTLFEPLVGYFLTASKIIDLTAFQLSILQAPEIAAGLAIAFTCAVAVAIALSPTHLRSPYACAIAVLLVPSDPEVFGIGAYAFWWAGLLLPLTVLWANERQWLRWVYIIVGGVSSPLIGTITILLVMRLVFERNRREMIACFVAACASVVQILGMRAQAAIGINPLTSWPSISSLPVIARQYVGAFFHVNTTVAGLVIAALLAILAWALRRRLDRYFVLLIVMFIAVAMTITIRLRPGDLASLNPFNVAPRYFFYPFVLLSWILIWLASISPRPVKVVLVAAFALTLALAGPRLSRRHDPIDWKYHVLACARADQYELPIHYIGRANEIWHLKLSGAQCRALLARSLF